MAKIIGIFDNWDTRSTLYIKHIMSDLIMAGIKENDVQFLSSNNDRITESPIQNHLLLKELGELNHTSVIQKQSLPPPGWYGYFYKGKLPFSIFKGATIGALAGLLIFILMLIVIPGIGSLLLSESPGIVLASGITGIGIGVTIGSIWGLPDLASQHNSIIAIVSADTGVEKKIIREIFTKHNASKINIFP